MKNLTVIFVLVFLFGCNAVEDFVGPTVNGEPIETKNNTGLLAGVKEYRVARNLEVITNWQDTQKYIESLPRTLKWDATVISWSRVGAGGGINVHFQLENDYSYNRLSLGFRSPSNPTDKIHPEQIKQIDLHRKIMANMGKKVSVKFHAHNVAQGFIHGHLYDIN